MTVLIIFAVYTVICAVVALIRGALDRRSTFGDSARRTFLTLFPEALNPFNWL